MWQGSGKDQLQRVAGSSAVSEPGHSKDTLFPASATKIKDTIYLKPAKNCNMSENGRSCFPLDVYRTLSTHSSLLAHVSFWSVKQSWSVPWVSEWVTKQTSTPGVDQALWRALKPWHCISAILLHMGSNLACTGRAVYVQGRSYQQLPTWISSSGVHRVLVQLKTSLAHSTQLNYYHCWRL